MKKILLTLVISLICLSSAYTQTVNGKPISEIKTKYVEIVGTAKAFSTKLNIKIDFGQEINFKSTKIKDKNGKPMVFNSMIDALNFMSENGYEYIDAYAVTESNSNIYHYLLKRKE